MRNQVFKKLFSVLLALIMVAGMLPASAMAGGWGAMDVDTTPELTETEQRRNRLNPPRRPRRRLPKSPKFPSLRPRTPRPR